MLLRASVRVLLVLCLIQSTCCYNILVSVLGVSGSQNLVMVRLAEHLAQRGHSVTVLKATMFAEAKMPKMEHSKLIEYVAMPAEVADKMSEVLWSMPWKTNDSGVVLPPFDTAKEAYYHMTSSCKRVIEKDSAEMKELSKTKWDVVVVHMVDFCAFGIAQVLGVKSTVWMSTAFMLEPFAHAAGVPSPASYVPCSVMHNTDDMTMFERAKNMFGTAAVGLAFTYLAYPGFTTVFREVYGNDFPDVETLARNVQLYYINADPFFEYPRPVLHNTIYIAGFTMQKPEALEPKWQQIVDKAGDNGIVIFSMGSVANTSAMPLESKMAFLNAFKRFPKVTFIFRLEGGFDQAKGVSNVHLTKWLPQKDLLATPTVRAFITHGGYNSLTEATYLGVPLIVMALFGDQHANVKRVERAQVGVALDKNELSADTVYQAINAVINDKAMQERADQLSRMIRANPSHPLDRAMEYIEFLAEFKTLDMLKPLGRHMGLIEYYCVDIILIMAGVCLLFLYVLFKCCKRCCCGKTAPQAKTKNKRE